VAEGKRNDLFRPESKVEDANVVLRQQAYWQGYCDGLGMAVRLPEAVAATNVDEHGVPIVSTVGEGR
jgi:hypothetical protein